MTRKMYLITSEGGAVNWAQTRNSILQNADKFEDAKINFGIGAESAYKCPGCGRTLPVMIFHLDHIYPRSRYAQINLGTISDANFVLLTPYMTQRNKSGGQFQDSSLGLGGEAAESEHEGKFGGRAQAYGGYVQVQVGALYNPKVTNVNASTIWENDLRNLQFLCGHCNTTKGPLTYIEWKGNDNGAQPLSRIFKDYYLNAMN